jgi:AhpD family alkylhydroperoxidase
MTVRINFAKTSPDGYKAMLSLSAYSRQAGLDAKLMELIKIRASQINGCAYCLDMHTKDARALGETEQRLYTLSAWRETVFLTERERAALAWTEALTDVADTHVPDELYEEVRRHFTEKELVDLSWAIVVINGWNRMAIAFRTEPGSYQPTKG